jgi:hypothetical protein
MEVIQALSERVMDDDAPCAMCALGCLGNYILFQDKNSHGTRVETLLTPILLTKMNKASDQVEAIAKKMLEIEQKENAKANDDNTSMDESKLESAENSKKEKKKKKIAQTNPMEKQALAIMEQYSIQSLALHVLCGIVESTAMNNESSSILYHQKVQFLSTMTRSFLLGTEMITGLSSGDSQMKKTIATKENQSNIISDVVSYTARTMHSACDDNPTLISSLLSSPEWAHIISAISNTTLPTLARLHCCGITIISRQIDESASRGVEQIIIQQSLPLLSQFTLYSNDIAMALHKEVSDAHQALSQQKQDEKIENDIIRAIDKKKESARLIARRQKEMKLKKKEEMDKHTDMETGSTNKSENGVVDDGIDSEESKQAREEAEERFDKAVNAWKNACLPLKLAIEIITNLCAVAIDGDGKFGAGDADDMDDLAWDSDQEEKLLAEAGGNQPILDMSKEDQHFLNLVVEAGVPDRVLTVFGSVFMALVDSGSNKNSIHPEVMDDLTEVLSKASICLGNMACNLQQCWKNHEKDVASMWSDYRQCLIVTKELTPNRNIPYSAMAAILSTMGAFLRFRAELMKFVNEQDLDLILSFVLIGVPDGANQNDLNSISDVQKEAIGMLGILCTEPHPDPINEKICTAFLTVLERSNGTKTDVICEVLNALMDMYSSDEGDANNHENVFRSKDVLGTFKRSVPMLKSKINAEKRLYDADEVEFFKESALNASRFIKYKSKN